MKTKQYRFFYHWRRQTDTWTVHFRNMCLKVDDVKCLVPNETKKNKRQPLRVIQGFCREVTVKNGMAVIS